MRKNQKGEFLSSRVRYIAIGAVRPNPQQPRRSFDETALRELADSIRAYGILQPLTVRDKGGYYELVAGERRLRAARPAGRREGPRLIPAAAEEDRDHPSAKDDPPLHPEATEEPTAEPEATEEPNAEPEATEEPAVEPDATEEPAAEPEATEEPTVEPDATEEPAAEPEATEEPAAEGRVLTTTITLPDEYTLDVELHLDANNVVTELKLTLENEIEGLTQEMLDAFAEQFVGKQLPVVLHADADETTAEEQIVEGMENQLENSRGIVEMLNKLAEQ